MKPELLSKPEQLPVTVHIPFQVSQQEITLYAKQTLLIL